MENTKHFSKMKTKIVKYVDSKNKQYESLYINLASGIFYARKTLDGKSHFVTLKTKSFSEAKAKIFTILHKASTGELEKPKSVLIKDFYNDMLAQKKAAGLSKNTLICVEKVWRNNLRDFWQNKTVKDVNQKTITDFVNWHHKVKPGNQIGPAFKYLSNILNVMIKSGHLQIHQKPELELPKAEEKSLKKQKGRYVSETEMNKMISNSNEFMKFVLSLAYITGMRKNEICSIELERIKKKENRYFIELFPENTKTGNGRTVPVPTELNEILEKFISKSKGRSKFLFPKKTDPKNSLYGQMIDEKWKQIKKKSGITQRTRFHDLRHSAATNFAKNKVNPSVACTILGMSIQVYQKVYLKLQPDDLAFAIDITSDGLKCENQIENQTDKS